ncbi:hypothetical protein HOC35_01620 [Candidatus Woesearchaeota archaeon]|jgi:hypothetical protein|nr:hypothetical protein [Candidatus Woesearchaeota archaeon]
MYKRGFITLILIILLLFLIPFVNSDFDTGENPEGNIDSVEAAQEAFTNGNAQGATLQTDAEANTNYGSKVGMKIGTTVTTQPGMATLDSKDTVKEDDNSYTNVENLVITENTVSVDSADSLESNGVIATGVTDFSQTKSTGSFDIKHADALQVGTTILTNVDNLNFFNDVLDFEHADYLKTDQFEAINIDDFSQEATKFTTSKTDLLNSNCLELTNIKNAEFIIDETKVFAKTNKLNIKDCLDNNITFEGNSIIASKDLPQSFSISKGTLTATFTNHTSIITTNSTTAATINHFGFTTIEMKSSSYTEKSNIKNKDFSIEAEDFLLFLRNHESENNPEISFCNNCGFIDKIMNKIELKGKVTYKRRNQLLMPVYESFSDNHAQLFMDENNIMIELFLLSGENANIYNNHFKIEEKDGIARIYYTPNYPNFIIEYFADINPKHRPILFNNNNLIFDPDNPFTTIITTEDLQEYEIEKCE